MQRLTVFAALIIGLLMLVPHHSVDAQGGLIVVTGNADVTGTGAAVQASTSGSARWVQVIAPSTNGAVIRCGGTTVSATVGAPVAAGGGLFFPAVPVDSRLSTSQFYYNLANIRCYVGSGDKVNFSWGTN